MKRKLRIIVPLLLLLAIAALAGKYYLFTKQKEKLTYLKLYGNVEMRTAQLAFKESERIAQVLVNEGDHISAGQALATLDTQRLTVQTAQAQAQVEALQAVVDRLEAGTRVQQIEQIRAEIHAAQTRVANAQQTYQRLRTTSGTGVTSEQDVDNARTQLAVEKAQLDVKQKALNLAMEGPRKEEIAEARSHLKAAQAAVELFTLRMQDMTLMAPSPGVIQNRILEPGEMAGPTRPIFTLALITPKWIRAYVPEPDLGRIAQGMPAEIKSDSFPDHLFQGWIGFISPAAEFTPKSVETTDLRTQLVYEVRVFTQDPQNRLRLGMPATVTVNPTAPTMPPEPDNSLEMETPQDKE